MRTGLEAAGYHPAADVTDDGQPRLKVRGIEILGPDGAAADVAFESTVDAQDVRDFELLLPMFPAATKRVTLDTLTQALTALATDPSTDVERRASVTGGRVEVTAFADGTIYVFLHPF